MDYLSNQSEHAFSQLENVLRAVSDRMRDRKGEKTNRRR
jgi:hypothetical protein